ncbi:ribosomal protein L28e [Jimgerdemannia flammicorona]|uniref:Ribosomal protein L28e n=1 Tax=Jimgerdemannia flammicorona TaxID=994334 RepID=A0A433D7L2_9FUNG|nr:ribosomal protein L28e [Jimgerdemannia flammicorona]
MSADLVWSLVKNNNAYLVKRPGVQFSSEPGNLTNLNTFKYSGLANNKTVGVVPAVSGKGIELITKKQKLSAHNVNKRVNKITIAKGSRRTALSVANIVARNGYRPDLRQASIAALARVSAILASQRPAKVHVKKTKGHRATRAKRA